VFQSAGPVGVFTLDARLADNGAGGNGLASFMLGYRPVMSGGTTGGTPSLRLADGLPVPVPTDHLNPSGSNHRRRMTFITLADQVVGRQI
jgi:hypothetical protein